MGTNTLTDVASNGTVAPANVNDIHAAVKGDFVPRNSSGVATNEAGSLGTAAFQWANVRTKNLFIDGVQVNLSQTGLQKNEIISGKVRTTSNQPAFLTPAGLAGGRTFTVAALATDLVYDVDGSQVTATSDVVSATLTAAPSTNNTALVDDADAADQNLTRQWGEPYGEKDGITIDTVGTEITGLVGTFQSFKINDGVNDEYFIAFVETTTKLSKIHRGFYYDSSLDPVNRITFTDNDSITLMTTYWVFLENDGLTIVTTSNPPSWSFDTPSGAVSGDHWYDLGNETWKKHDGVSFVAANSTWLGYAVVDASDCIVARCRDFGGSYDRENNIILENESATVMRGKYAYSKVSVAENNFNFEHSLPSWDMATDLASSVDLYSGTEQASTIYYLYIKKTGETVISDIEPYYRFDFYGFYHPHNPWRCVGYVFNDSSSDFDFFSLTPGAFEDQEYDSLRTDNESTTSTVTSTTFVTMKLNATDSETGSAIKRATDVLNFKKISYYRFVVTFQHRVATAGGAGDEFRVKIRNTTDSKDLALMDLFGVEAAVERLGHVQMSKIVRVTEIDDDYEIQVGRTSGTAQIDITNNYVLVQRITQPFYWG